MSYLKLNRVGRLNWLHCAIAQKVRNKSMKFQKLKQVISGRLIKNHFTNNLRSPAILEMFRDPAGIAQSLNQVEFQESEALLTQLNSATPNGLANSKLMRFARIIGINQLQHEKFPQFWILLLHCYNSNACCQS